VWTDNQRQRLYLEHVSLQREGFDQFDVYQYRATDTYEASGVATSNSGRKYSLHIPIPSGFPNTRPAMYLTEPYPLLMADGRTTVSSLGVSHAMHTLTPTSSGLVQICHWRDDRWHAGILLHKVFLKGLIWIEAYEQHLATGRSLSEFVATMAGRS
jgi:ubiquitin-protein ligase